VLQRLAFQAVAYLKGLTGVERQVALYIALNVDAEGYADLRMGDCATLCCLSQEEICEALAGMLKKGAILGGPSGFTFPGVGSADR
jgi:hypothetical protein